MNRVFRIFSIICATMVAIASTCWAQNPQAVLSWGGLCPTSVKNMNFYGPASYRLWVGLKNLTAADKNIGSDVSLYFGPTVADAWRFDAAGCQAFLFDAHASTPDTKSCPTMRGTNPLDITDVEYNPTTMQMSLRLSETYDPFTPAPGVTYTLWIVDFNHANSVLGVDGDPSTCDNAGQPMTVSIGAGTDPSVDSFLRNVSNTNEFFGFADPSDQTVTWNAACAQTAVEPVPEAQASGISLQPSYPNPSNRSSRGEFTLSVAGQNRLTVYDAAGRLVKVLHDGWDEAGKHEFAWDGTDGNGRSAQAGVYFIRLEVGGQTSSERLVRIP